MSRPDIKDNPINFILRLIFNSIVIIIILFSYFFKFGYLTVLSIPFKFSNIHIALFDVQTL